MGVLELYHDQPGPLSAVELARALLCADVAFWALLGVRAGADSEVAEPQRLTDLNGPRAQIHRAIEDRALGDHPSTPIPGLAFLCVTLAAAIVLEARALR